MNIDIFPPRIEAKKYIDPEKVPLAKKTLENLDFELYQTSYIHTLYFISGQNWSKHIRLRTYLDNAKDSQNLSKTNKYTLEYKVPSTGEKIRLSGWTLDKFIQEVHSGELKDLLKKYDYNLEEHFSDPIQLHLVIFYKREYYRPKGSTSEYPRVTFNMEERYFHIDQELEKIDANIILEKLASKVDEINTRRIEAKIAKEDNSELSQKLQGMIEKL